MHIAKVRTQVEEAEANHGPSRSAVAVRGRGRRRARRVQRDQREDLADGADRDRLGHTQPALDPRRPAEAARRRRPWRPAPRRARLPTRSHPDPGADRRHAAACPRATTPTRPARWAATRSSARWTRPSPCSRSSSRTIFDFNSKNCENCYYVKNQAKFTAGVIRNLNAVGLCANYDGEELGGEELELVQRPVRHPRLLRPHPPRRGVVPEHLPPVLVLSQRTVRAAFTPAAHL